MSGSFAWADLLFWYGLNNLIVAIPIALLAWWVQVKRRSPSLSYLLWLAVLLKLVTPPFMSIPVAPVYSGASQLVATSASTGAAVETYLDWKALLVAVWMAGSVCAIVWSLYCILRFNRLLSITSVPAGAAVRFAAQESVRLLGLRKTPVVLATTANVPPMLWWVGGRVRMYLPADLISRLEPAEIRLIVAHELGHVRLRHHYVRWFEWLVSVGFWWNPLAWWARKNLRLNEELCCDAFVVSKLNLPGRVYARSLLSALESLASPAIRPPVMATGIDGGGSIERRIQMLISKAPFSRASRWGRWVTLAIAAVLLPLGFSMAQDTDDLKGVEAWLDAGVNSAFLTQEQADAMLRALKKRDPAIRAATALKEVALQEREVAMALARLDELAASGQLTEEQALQRQDLIHAQARMADRMHELQLDRE